MLLRIAATTFVIVLPRWIRINDVVLFFGVKYINNHFSFLDNLFRIG